MSIHFESWTFDINNQLLRHNNGSQVILNDNQAKLLMALINAAPRHATKDELLNAIWEDTVVTENSLNQLLSDVRKILGDDAKDPTFIKTIPRKGFIWLSPVTSNLDSALPFEKKHIWATVIGLIVILIIFTSALFYPKSSSFTNKVISPNGMALAYYEIYENDAFLTIEFADEFTSPIVLKVTNVKNTIFSWSPDSNKVVYNATQEQHEYYSFNVIDIKTNHISYYKSPKNNTKNLKETLPDNFNKPSVPVIHNEGTFMNNVVNVFEHSKTESISVYLEGGEVVSFNWLLRD